MGLRIFMSYRRDDSGDAASRIRDRLIQAFGDECVMQDRSSITPRQHWEIWIQEMAKDSDIMLVIIGEKWLQILKERLDNPRDWVRIEIETALQQDDLVVIPALLENTPMPERDELPPDLRDLTKRQAVRIHGDPHFNDDVHRLVESIRKLFPEHTGDSGKKPEEKLPERPAVAPFPPGDYFKWVIAGGVLFVLVVTASVLVVTVVNDRSQSIIMQSVTPSATTVPVSINPSASFASPPPVVATPEPVTFSPVVTMGVPPTLLPTLTPSATFMGPPASTGKQEFLSLAVLNAWRVGQNLLPVPENTLLVKLVQEHATHISTYSSAELDTQDVYLFDGVLPLSEKKTAAGYGYTGDAVMVVIAKAGVITLQDVYVEASRQGIDLLRYPEAGFARLASLNGRQNLVLILGQPEA